MSRLILADKGVSAWSISQGIPAPGAQGVSESERFALEEFTRLFREVSGVALPVTDYTPGAQNQIVIGGQRDNSLGDDGFTISADASGIKIAGSPVRGVLYGVYTFFEDFLGCRYLSSDVVKIPRRETVEIPFVSRREKPVLEYRESFFTDMHRAGVALPNKCNGASCALENRHGGKISYHGFVHTFFPMIPPSEYFDAHPEYYSEIDGKRVHERAQLCLSNPEVLQIVIDKVRKGFRENPSAKIASVSQNDWHGNCQCAKCRAADEEEGSPAGSLLRFVNAVADAVKDEFPDRYIDTLAYQYTRKPPKITRPRKNVIIRLCSIECCFAHSLETCAALDKNGRSLNGAFVDDMKAWAKTADNIYVWDYVVNFSHYLMPFPNLGVLRDSIKFYIAHNVKGIFEQGCYTTEHGEMAALRGYVLAKLLWNPDYDVDLAVNEFLTGYFGMAAAPIRKYIDILNSRAAAENTPEGQHFEIFIKPPANFFTDDLLSEFGALFDRAEALADNDEILKRVKIARLAPEYARMYLCAGSREEKREAIESYFTKAAALGITRVNEWQDISDTKKVFLEKLEQE